MKGIAGKIPQIVDDNSGGRQLHVLYGVIWKLRGAIIENCNTNSSQVHRSTIQKDRAHNDLIRLIHYSPKLIHGHQPSRQTPTLQISKSKCLVEIPPAARCQNPGRSEGKDALARSSGVATAGRFLRLIPSRQKLERLRMFSMNPLVMHTFYLSTRFILHYLGSGRESTGNVTMDSRRSQLVINIFPKRGIENYVRTKQLKLASCHDKGLSLALSDRTM